MPDPLLYFKSMCVAATVSAIVVLAVVGSTRPVSKARLNFACVVGIGFGLLAGENALSMRLVWPPMNGLDRFLTIVIPATLAVELIAGFRSVPDWVARFLRIGLASMIPRILLHGSVYLSGSTKDWTPWELVTLLAVCVALLAGVWSLLSWLSRRSPGASIPLALCLTSLCTSVTMMMAGYIKGGIAGFALVATLMATTIVSMSIMKRAGAPLKLDAPAILGIGVVGLFGLLIIGRFFGRLSTSCALVLLLTPLLCWASETPLLRQRKPWVVGSIRLMRVAIPLVVVLAMAKRDFDRNLGRLLGKVEAPTFRLDRERAH